VTDDATTDPRPALPPDPVEYDSNRARIARAKGLNAPYIAGGRDPDPERGLREERYYGRLLVYMVVTLILAGFVLGVALVIATGSPPR
jgi:hypothetical protein